MNFQVRADLPPKCRAPLRGEGSERPGNLIVMINKFSDANIWRHIRRINGFMWRTSMCCHLMSSHVLRNSLRELMLAEMTGRCCSNVLFLNE